MDEDFITQAFTSMGQTAQAVKIIKHHHTG